jgi:hypothetical protein
MYSTATPLTYNLVHVQERTVLQVPDVSDTAVTYSNALPNSLGGAGFSIGDPDVLAYGLAVDTYSGPSDGVLEVGVTQDL